MPTDNARTHRIRRAAALLGAAFLLTACSANSSPTAAATPTAASAVPHTIDFAVTGHGTATLTWPGGTTSHAKLPWQTVRHIPLGADGVTLTVQLDATGGAATCSIIVDGTRLTSSLAQGPNGRATCHTGASGAGGQADD